MYSRAVCSRDDDRAEFSAVVDNRNEVLVRVPKVHYSFRIQTIGEKNIGYTLTSQDITF